ncbi:hypothetical protein LUZ60_007744 [Juncus effusus]|nr:hypothetical protein LUZ60_007744 [Juncus effusus]
MVSFSFSFFSFFVVIIIHVPTPRIIIPSLNKSQKEKNYVSPKFIHFLSRLLFRTLKKSEVRTSNNISSIFTLNSSVLSFGSDAMLAACGCQYKGPAKLPWLGHSCGGSNLTINGGSQFCKERWRRSRSVLLVVAKAGRLSSFFSSRIGLDSPTYKSRDSSQILWTGPTPGDISEIEAFCRIFRSAEQLHNAIMETLCNPETGECSISYDLPSEELPILEEKVVAVLGHMLALSSRAKEEIISGRSVSGKTESFEANLLEGKLPPLASFRGEMKRCCESLQVALFNYLSPNLENNSGIWRRLQRLRNVCYDAGFSRADGSPSPTCFANWYAVYLNNEDSEPAFWRGGQVTEEGLDWLLNNGFKTIVDLREKEEGLRDERYEKALNEAVLSGKIELVNLPVEIGTVPSAEQVKKFAFIVNDLSKRPIYLHSREGVNRTSAMVSRWRQYIARSSKQNNSNGKMSKNGNVGTNGSVILESKNGSVLEINERSSEKEEIIGENGNGAHLSISVSENNEEVKGESLEDFRMDKNPFTAQIPTCNIFSRKEMNKFLKSRKIYPTNYLNSRKKRFDKLQADIQKNTNSSIKGNQSPSLNNSNNLVPKNGNPKSLKSNTNNIQVEQTSQNKPTNNPTPTPKPQTSNNPNPNSNSNSNSDSNMCASTTGVVRLQSRRKAEMFLVRTDGFSCTREKVTESSLAFTHPSTQQQMLMWKSPPKTVLLLKKLGPELMEEAKEVAKFLYYQEKMNVLVEPDVHDIFARMPGYGFVQTFYSQDTSDLHERVDFVACLGGDGVILHASNLFRSAVPPVVSFNLGSLGFLTSHTFEDFRQDLRAVIHGNNTTDGVYITLRMRLRCEIFRNGNPIPGKVFDVLNEAVVDRGSNPYLSKIECYEHNRLITKVQGDGVIVATPTGSTAYSTAAGGSMCQ